MRLTKNQVAGIPKIAVKKREHPNIGGRAVALVSDVRNNGTVPLSEAYQSQPPESADCHASLYEETEQLSNQVKDKIHKLQTTRALLTQTYNLKLHF
jgi:hypothetical protein